MTFDGKWIEIYLKYIVSIYLPITSDEADLPELKLRKTLLSILSRKFFKMYYFESFIGQMKVPVSVLIKEARYN